MTAPTPVVRAATRLLSFAALSILTALTAIAPLSIDMYLPGFPAMVTELGATSSAIQLTMTTFLLGMAIGQLVIGPLSDAMGRRLPLIAGSVLCLAATVVCAVAPAAGAPSSGSSRHYSPCSSWASSSGAVRPSRASAAPAVG
ncbi:MFS transporter [Microbacterium saccharophilum]|uniref:MFS transporter n=1 Tax=Microbacterium saccharophilum TaxID=1213358 RepID=UPI001C3F850A|nr:MFS transporter [Microbacterium saccharophilum]